MDDKKERKRMVVEEVGSSPTPSETPQLNEVGEQVKEKVEELQDINEHISDDLQKSADVQEELVEVAEKVQDSDHSLTSTSTTVEPSEFSPSRSQNGPNPLIIIVPGVLLLGALLGGIYFYQKNIGNLPQTYSTPLPIESTSPTPTATPTTTKVDLTKYSINVMNGSGISGEAGKVKDLLTTSGFKVGSTGNASSYSYTKTIIKAKSTVETEFLTSLSNTLSKNYVVDKTQTLSSSSSDDVQVIVGSTKASN